MVVFSLCLRLGVPEALLNRKSEVKGLRGDPLVKVPVAKLDDLSSNPWTHMVAGNNGLPQVAL